MKFTIELGYIDTVYRYKQVEVCADSTSEALNLAKRGMYNSQKVLKEIQVDEFQQEDENYETKIVSVIGKES